MCKWVVRQLEVSSCCISLQAFEHLCALELVRPVSESSGVMQRAPPEYRLVTLMVDPSEIMDALQKYPSCPTDIRQWAASAPTA
jgi:origin recognition complex subunit 4